MKPLLFFALLPSLSLLKLVFATTTIIDILSRETRFSSIIHALQQTGLIPYINNNTLNGLTLFAPINEAFTDPDKIKVDRFTFHILPFKSSSTTWKNGTLLETALVKDDYLGVGRLGQRLKVKRTATDVLLGNVRILETDLKADNGVIHVIDGLLDPPAMIVDTSRNTPDLTLFADVVSSSGFIDTLNSAHPFTIFAPVNSAIEAVDDLTRQYLLSSYAHEDMKSALKYHTHPSTLYVDEIENGPLEVPVMVDGRHEMVKNDDSVTLDGHQLKDVDIIASNGVIHTLSRFLIPPSFHMHARKLLIGMGLTRFVDLFDSSGLSFHLSNHSSQNPITVLAFSNNIFDKSRWKADDEPSAVRQMLEYHVLAGTYGMEDFRDNDVLHTMLSSSGMNGRRQVVTVSVTEKDGAREIWINEARIIGASLYVEAQGVTIHTISQVLSLPDSPIQSIIADLNFSTFVTTLISSHLESTVRDTRSVTLFVPTNAAFAHLGAVMSYLLLPEALPKLQSLVKYHIATSVIYVKDLPGMERDRVEATFSTLDGANNITVRVAPHAPHLIIGNDQTHPSQFTSDPPRNHPSTTGNIFTITQVLLPPTLHIELKHLLEGLHARTITRLFMHASIPVLDTPPENPYTLLVPSETSFNHIDVDELMSNPKLLLRTVRAHIVKGRAELADGAHWETLNDGMWVLVSSLGQDAWELEIVDAKGAPVVLGSGIGRARVLRKGEALNGNVFEVDRVFLIQPTSGFPWIGVVLSIVSLGLVGAVGGGTWWYFRRRRSTRGYEAVGEEGDD